MGPGEENKNTVIDPVLIEIVLPGSRTHKGQLLRNNKEKKNKVYVVSVEVKVKEQLDPYIDGGKLTFVDRDGWGCCSDPEPDNEQSTVAVVDDEADGV